MVQENFELTDQGELGLNGFLQLHLMEAEDNCGKLLNFNFLHGYYLKNSQKYMDVNP